MRERVAVFMCNLKPAKMRGVLSEGMIMCAVGEGKTEILVPPTDSVVGDRVTVAEYPGMFFFRNLPSFFYCCFFFTITCQLDISTVSFNMVK